MFFLINTVVYGVILSARRGGSQVTQSFLVFAMKGRARLRRVISGSIRTLLQGKNGQKR